MRYYLVKCKFGHVGRDKYLSLIVPIVAESVKEASKSVQNFSVVKRDHKDWCLERLHLNYHNCYDSVGGNYERKI